MSTNLKLLMNVCVMRDTLHLFYFLRAVVMVGKNNISILLIFSILDNLTVFNKYFNFKIILLTRLIPLEIRKLSL